MNNYFYIGYFDYSIEYTCFVRNFVNIFVWAIYIYNWSYMVNDFLNNSGCLGMVFQNYYYCLYSCLVDFDLFKCIDRKRPIWFFVLLRFILIVSLFLSKFGNTVSVSSAIITPFFER